MRLAREQVQVDCDAHLGARNIMGGPPWRSGRSHSHIVHACLEPGSRDNVTTVMAVARLL